MDRLKIQDGRRWVNVGAGTGWYQSNLIWGWQRCKGLKKYKGRGQISQGLGAMLWYGTERGTHIINMNIHTTGTPG